MIDGIFSGYRWYRRLSKAKWELWYSDVVNDYAWFRCPHGMTSTYVNRGPLQVEDYTGKDDK